LAFTEKKRKIIFYFFGKIMPICEVNKTKTLIEYAYRNNTGDITEKHYCYSKRSRGKQNKLTHPECKKNNLIIYKNGEGYDKNFKIIHEKKYLNLIGCWCNENLRFKNEEQLLNHIEGKTHPEEFEEFV
jgi:hypothetical protein